LFQGSYSVLNRGAKFHCKPLRLVCRQQDHQRQTMYCGMVR
jgi:hypothetical protein